MPFSLLRRSSTDLGDEAVGVSRSRRRSSSSSGAGGPLLNEGLVTRASSCFNLPSPAASRSSSPMVSEPSPESSSAWNCQGHSIAGSMRVLLWIHSHPSLLSLADQDREVKRKYYAQPLLAGLLPTSLATRFLAVQNYAPLSAHIRPREAHPRVLVPEEHLSGAWPYPPLHPLVR